MESDKSLTELQATNWKVRTLVRERVVRRFAGTLGGYGGLLSNAEGREDLAEYIVGQRFAADLADALQRAVQL